MQAPPALERAKRFHLERPLAFWGIALGALAVLLAVGSYVAPEPVLHQFIWKNFWGPTEADARQAPTISADGRSGGIERFGIRVDEDYTLTSELVYGAILAGALYSIYVHLFRKPGIVCDGRFILALTPYILFGPVGRVLEDANTFCRAGTDCDPTSLSYPFISPVIYLFDALIVVAHMLLMRRVAGLGPVDRVRGVGAALALQVGVYGFVVSAWPGEFSYVLPVWQFAAIVLGAFVVYYAGETRGWDPFRTGLFALGLPVVVGPMAMVARWVLLGTWGEEGATNGLHGPIVPYAVGMALGVTAAVWLVARVLRKDAPGIAALGLPLNLGVVFGHMLDGFATFLAVCGRTTGSVCTGAAGFGLGIPGAYGEKHPVSKAILGIADGWGFPALKLALVLVILHLVDRSATDKREDVTLIGLVKMAVLILGLAPGTRDVLRVAMGV